MLYIGKASSNRNFVRTDDATKDFEEIGLGLRNCSTIRLSEATVFLHTALFNTIEREIIAGVNFHAP